MEKLIITPKTKIFDLLEAYPQLEEVLIATAPPFRKLKNPVLRKTITRITSLSQAAAIGGLNTTELVNRLRSEVGQKTDLQTDQEQHTYQTTRPDWFDESAISETIDIRIMLNTGEQPINRVFSAIKKLNDNEILKVIAPFIPAPLIDKSLSLGFSYWLDKRSDKAYYVYFKR